jgi:hypothetical protein
MLSAIFIFSCGKKNENVKTEDKSSTEKSTSTDEISPSSSFMVTFDITGKVTGKTKNYYDNKKMRVDNEMSIGGQKISSQVISDGEWVYIISEYGGKKMGMKMNVKYYTEDQQKKGEFDISSFRDKLKTYQKTGTEEILGKQCDIYKVNDKTTISVYKDMIPLKVVATGGDMTMVATSYEINPKVPDDFFTPPSGVEYKELNAR